MSATKPTAKPLKSVKFSRYLKWIILALVLAIIAFFVYKKFNPTQTAPEYLATTVETGDIENTVLASGKIKAIKTVDVGAQVSGEITQLYVEIGDQVKKRDLIAQISQIEQKQRLKRPSITISS